MVTSLPPRSDVPCEGPAFLDSAWHRAEKVEGGRGGVGGVGGVGSGSVSVEIGYF